MIEHALRSVQEGTSLSEVVEHQLSGILTRIGAFKQALLKMQEASEKKRAAIASMATSIGGIEKVTQSNAAQAEESAAASHEMEEQSLSVLKQIEHLEAVLIGRQAAFVANQDETSAEARTVGEASSPEPLLRR